MNNSAVLLLILAVLILFSTVNTIRMWQGKAGWIPRPLSAEKRNSFIFQRGMAVNAMGSFVWWSFALAIGGRYGLRKESSSVVRALLYVPLVGGLSLLATLLCTMISIFLSGKPIKFIPPQFRDAAAKGWHEDPML